jgi:hypothetical protein
MITTDITWLVLLLRPKKKMSLLNILNDLTISRSIKLKLVLKLHSYAVKVKPISFPIVINTTMPNAAYVKLKTISLVLFISLLNQVFIHTTASHVFNQSLMKSRIFVLL